MQLIHPFYLLLYRFLTHHTKHTYDGAVILCMLRTCKNIGKHLDIPPNLLSQKSVENTMNRKNKNLNIVKYAVKPIFVKLFCPRLAILLNCIYIQIEKIESFFPVGV